MWDCPYKTHIANFVEPFQINPSLSIKLAAAEEKPQLLFLITLQIEKHTKVLLACYADN